MKDQLQHHHQKYEKIIHFEGNQLISLYSGEDNPKVAFKQVKADVMILTLKAYANIRQHDIQISHVDITLSQARPS